MKKTERRMLTRLEDNRFLRSARMSFESAAQLIVGGLVESARVEAEKGLKAIQQHLRAEALKNATNAASGRP